MPVFGVWSLLSAFNNMSTIRAHPCALVSQRVIEKLKIKQTSDHWKSANKALFKNASLSYKPQPIEHVNIAPFGKGVGHKEFTQDAEQAVQHAVAFVISANTEYAKKARSIIHAWANTCKSFEGSNAPLELGWGGCSLVRAAEILRYTYPGWTPADKAAIDRFIDSIMLPKLRTKLGWTNNWQTTICEARLQIAIFRDDPNDFNWAITEYKRILAIYVTTSDGQTCETMRDLVHAQFGIGGLIQIPELVYEYTRGAIDLFKECAARPLAKVCELHAHLLLGRVPESCTTIRKEHIKEPWFLPCGWEIALHHIERRLGIPLPATRELLAKNRPEGYVFHWGLGTLTHFCCA